jgi:phospholipid N-methyltransferase
MSAALFFKRFLKRPMQVASIVPSSPALIRRVASKFDFSAPRVVAEFGPGEGCHTRELARRMGPESQLLLFELDPELANHLRHEFRDDPRVEVLNTDAMNLATELAARGIASCDYVVSGIPFSTMEINKKRELLRAIHASLAPAPWAAFIIYQVTNELRGHGARIFPRIQSEYCLQNIPPMFVTVFHRQPLNGHSHASGNGNGNGNGHSSGRSHGAAAGRAGRH